MFRDRSRRLGCTSLAAVLGAVALMGAALSTAHASLLAYEPFNYAVGSSIGGQTATGLGFTGTWTGGSAATIASGSLSYGNLATSANSLIGGVSTVTSVKLTTPVAATPNNPLWFSFLMQTPATASGVTSGYDGLVLELAPSDSTSNYPFIGFANSGAFVVRTQGGGGDANGPIVSANTTYLMVLEDIALSGGPDELNLWVDPTPGATSPLGLPTLTDLGIGPIGDIYGIGTNDGPTSTSYDEIRIGTSYEGVTPVPEPAILGLLCLGSLSLLMLKRRQPV